MKKYRLILLITLLCLFAFGFCGCGADNSQEELATATAQADMDNNVPETTADISDGETENSPEAAVEDITEAEPEPSDEPRETVVYEFELSDYYSDYEGVFIVPGYPWSEFENPGKAIKEEYNVEIPALYDPNPEILFSFTLDGLDFVSAPYFSAGSSYGLDLIYSSEDMDNVPEMADALIAALTELFGEPMVDDISGGQNSDEVFEWSYRWNRENDDARTILSVFYYHSDSSKMNYEIQLHLQKN